LLLNGFDGNYAKTRVVHDLSHLKLESAW